MPRARVTSRWESSDAGPVLVLKSDRPAVFVTATTNVPGYFSDNAVTLLPGPRNPPDLHAAPRAPG